jgi:biopolymer transport protein ExbD
VERDNVIPAVERDNAIKVKVTMNGEITADGQPVTLEKLAARLADLKQAGGVVWYHRENPAGEPHANAMKVIELVAESKLPIRLSTKPDFSDAVDDKGVSRPDKR